MSLWGTRHGVMGIMREAFPGVRLLLYKLLNAMVLGWRVKVQSTRCLWQKRRERNERRVTDFSDLFSSNPFSEVISALMSFAN